MSQEPKPTRGTVIAVSTEQNSIDVRTREGNDLKNVPIVPPSLSNLDKTGYHYLPRVGDQVILAWEEHQWHVSGFAPPYHPSGKYTVKRPTLFKAGGQHIHSDMSGLDILPSVENAVGLSHFAVEKLGLAEEELVFPTVIPTAQPPVSDIRKISQTSSLDYEINFSIPNISRALVPCDACTDSIGDTLTDPPTVSYIDVGAIVLATSLDNTYVTITLTGANFSKLGDKDDITVSLCGMNPVLYAVQDFSDTVVKIKLKRSTKAEPKTPEGTFDIVFFNKKTLICFRVLNAISIHTFEPGKIQKVYFETPKGYYFILSDVSSIYGILYTMRSDIPGAVLQTSNFAFIQTSNTKYIGSPGGIEDFVKLASPAGKIVSSSAINSFRSNTLTLAEIRQIPEIDFSYEITGYGDTEEIREAVKNRLSGRAITKTIFDGDNTRENRGLGITNLADYDKFSIKVFKEFDKVIPDYSTPAIIDYTVPDVFPVPLQLFFEIRGENIRYGSTFMLIQQSKLVDQGQPNERLVALTDPKPKISLGLDRIYDAQTITLTDAGALKLTGTSIVYRISDKLIGFKLDIKTISDDLRGEYDVVIVHPSQTENATKAKGVFFRSPTYDPAHPPTSGTVGAGGAISGGSTDTGENVSSSPNVYYHQVKVKDKTKDEPETLFTYAVDDSGRLDISSKGGVYINGLQMSDGSATNSMAATIGDFNQNLSFASDKGDGSILTKDGSIVISAAGSDTECDIKGSVYILATNCVAVGPNSKKIYIGRKAQKLQLGNKTVQMSIGKNNAFTVDFPYTMTGVQLVTGQAISVGPILVPGSDMTFIGQLLNSSTRDYFLTIKVSEPLTGKWMEGFLRFLFVRDANDTSAGDKEHPFRGTWHIPLA